MIFLQRPRFDVVPQLQDCIQRINDILKVFFMLIGPILIKDAYISCQDPALY